MTDSQQSASRKPFSLNDFFRKNVLENPIIMKELRGRMYGARAYVIPTIYLILISGVVSIIYLSIVSTGHIPDPNTYQLIGKIVFGTVLALQFALASVITPALTTGIIASEKEHQTFDLIKTTLRPARSLVNSKLSPAVLFLLLLLFVAFPSQSLAYLLGSVGFIEIGVSTLILVIYTLTLSIIGVFFSSLFKRTLPATMLTYLLVLGLMIGLPTLLILLLVMFEPIIGQIFFGLSYHWMPSRIYLWQLYLLAFAIWFSIIGNPVLAALASKILLTEEGTLFFWQLQIPTGNDALTPPTIPIISPWIGFCVFYLLLSIFLYLLSILIIKRKKQ